MTTFERNKTEAQSQVKFVQIPGSKFGSKICVSDSVKLDLMSKAWTQSQRENNFFNTHTQTQTHTYTYIHTNTLSLLHTKHTHTISLLHTLFLSHHTHTHSSSLFHSLTYIHTHTISHIHALSCRMGTSPLLRVVLWRSLMLSAAHHTKHNTPHPPFSSLLRACFSKHVYDAKTFSREGERLGDPPRRQ